MSIVYIFPKYSKTQFVSAEVTGELHKLISKLVLMFWQISMDASVSSLYAHGCQIHNKLQLISIVLWQLIN